jgi:hypothetical protein
VNEFLGCEELDLPLSADLDPFEQTESLTDTQEKIGAVGRREAVGHAPTDDSICQLLRRVRRETHEEAKDLKAISLRRFLNVIHVD